jgi:hypothetical protein
MPPRASPSKQAQSRHPRRLNRIERSLSSTWASRVVETRKELVSQGRRIQCICSAAVVLGCPYLECATMPRMPLQSLRTNAGQQINSLSSCLIFLQASLYMPYSCSDAVHALGFRRNQASFVPGRLVLSNFLFQDVAVRYNDWVRHATGDKLSALLFSWLSRPYRRNRHVEELSDFAT